MSFHPIKTTTTCTEKDCQNPEYSKGMCKRHYYRAYYLENQQKGHGIKDQRMLTYVECAEIMGISPTRCRQLEFSALEKVRKGLLTHLKLEGLQSENKLRAA